MFVIRQSFRGDAEQVLSVARHLDTVNLPANAEHIERILERSEESFKGSVEPHDREFVFVLEDVDAKRVIGTSMIHAQHGTRREPHVFFQVLEDERYSQTLDRYFVHQCLRIGYNYNGPTEIGGLILLPEFRGHRDRLGTLLSYARFLFIAMHRGIFRKRVLSELLPPLEKNGSSLLWEHLGRRFTGMTYQEADLESTHNKEFIKALFPHSLIYTSLFPPNVQSIIGKVGPETRGVEKILRRIGFEYAGQIDPFDGGPHFIADTDSITLVRDSRTATVADDNVDELGDTWTIVATESNAAPRFRATFTRTSAVEGDTIVLSSAVREALDVSAGDTVWLVAP